MENEMEMIPQSPEDAGRGTDNVMAHLSLGEIVIPRAFLDDPQVMQALQAIFRDGGADINQYTVGHEANSINPETGYPEFFKFKKLFKALAPLALSFLAPGLGTAIGSTLLGAGAAGASTLGSSLLGAGIGGLAGNGGKGALMGALGGGIGANLGSLPGGVAQGASQIGQTAPVGYGSGILGALGKATGINAGSLPSLSGLSGGIPGGGSTFSLGSSISSALGGLADDAALKKAQKELLAGNQQQLDNIGSYDAGEYLNDPEYKYAQEQGDQAVNRSLGAQGSIFSGRALQAANEQNKALNTDFQNRYYQKYLDRNNLQNPLYAGNANTRAQTGIQRASNLGSSLASILNPQKQYSLEDLMRLGA